MECVASTFSPHHPSMSLRIVLIISCIDWIAFSTIPLLFKLPTRQFSLIILDRLVIALSAPSQKPRHQFSSCPVSRRVPRNNCTEDGSRLFFSRQERKRLSFVFLSHEHVIEVNFGDLSLSLHRSATIFSSSPHDAMSAPAAEQKTSRVPISAHLAGGNRACVQLFYFRISPYTSCASCPPASSFSCSSTPSIFATPLSLLTLVFVLVSQRPQMFFNSSRRVLFAEPHPK